MEEEGVSEEDRHGDARGHQCRVPHKGEVRASVKIHFVKSISTLQTAAGEGNGKSMKRNQKDAPGLLFRKSLWLGNPGWRAKG